MDPDITTVSDHALAILLRAPLSPKSATEKASSCGASSNTWGREMPARRNPAAQDILDLYFHGMTYGEIAAATGQTRSAVAGIVWRFIRRKA